MSLTGEPVKVELVSPLAMKILKLLYIKGELPLSGIHVDSSRGRLIDAIDELRGFELLAVRVIRDVAFYSLNKVRSE